MSGVQVVLVHGIRTSATMWRTQVLHLQGRGVDVHALDLPGHGSRMDEEWSLEEAFATLDRALRSAGEAGPVLLVGHSMGGILSTAYLARDDAAPVAAFVAVGATALPRGAGLALYRMLLRGMQRMPGNGMWLVQRILRATLPEETRTDLGAGGYALRSEDAALASLATLDIRTALTRLTMPVWFVNGEWDQLRLHERLFTRLVPHAELIVVPRSTHLVTTMRPAAFSAVLDLAIAVVESTAAQA
ncbi:alpha/beta hydrolase [Microbacterium sp. JZ70]